MYPVGAHQNIPLSEYRSWDAINQTKLGLLKRSPAHFKHMSEQEDKITEAFTIGQAVHTACLEPDKMDRYAVAPDCDKRTKAGKEMYQSWLETVGDKTIIDTDTYALSLAISKSVREHKTASKLLVGGVPELSLLWEPLTFNLRCKARLDLFNPTDRFIVDIKTTDQADRFSFTRSIFKYGYARQAAWYLDGAKQLGYTVDHFVWIVVEKTAPYGIQIFRLEDKDLALSHQENQDLLKLYQFCRSNDQWPGYPEQVQDISLPQFELNRLEEIYG